MGNAPIACVGKYNDAADVGAPRPDGRERMGSRELQQQLESVHKRESVISVCHQTSDTATRNRRQREEVDDLIVHIGSMASMNTGMSLSTAATVGAVNSQLRFMEPDQTIIIFDWDDTLCPSTFMKRRSQATRGPLSKSLKQSIPENISKELDKLTDQVIPLLRAAQAMGKVVLVTNARRPWVNTSCGKYIPKIQEALKGIDVVYAMEFVCDSAPLTTSTLTESKARAMKAAVGEFYSKYAGQSWKNLISVGDALYEHEAIRQVARNRPGGKYPKKCRTKTVKLIEAPTIPGMVMQLSLLENWLAKIVLKDDDVDIDFAGSEANIKSWINEFGNDGLNRA
eukprot:TRINITY_DN6463_c0_g1_i2.p1 TRINITY_DN6463_c0_g1~~TRINITY_DN6463_c0_g1_i2.p1  ORF type:complete len:340 (-),score=99.33 TRINITY_DN6463_c0_g1_i2:337-1356(-)